MIIISIPYPYKVVTNNFMSLRLLLRASLNAFKFFLHPPPAYSLPISPFGVIGCHFGQGDWALPFLMLPLLTGRILKVTGQEEGIDIKVCTYDDMMILGDG